MRSPAAGTDSGLLPSYRRPAKFRLQCEGVLQTDGHGLYLALT